MGGKGSKSDNSNNKGDNSNKTTSSKPATTTNNNPQTKTSSPPPKIEEKEQDDGEQVTQPGGEGEIKDDGDGSRGEEAMSFFERNKTYKPEKKLKGQKQQNLQKTIKATMKATLGGGDLRKTVQLPPGEDPNEWIAVNTVHFYNAANMIYGTCAEFCTDQTCKTMSAGKNEYLWQDGVNYKKPTRVTAPVYIDLLLNWVNEQISNPDLFPVDENAKFPRTFMKQVKDIYKRLFRLYAHLYYSHFEKIASIGAKAHLNTCFKHFVFFILEFKLVDESGLAPLKNFIDKFKDQKDI